MKSIWNPNRFLKSVAPWVHGNPQPTKSEGRRIVAGIVAFRRPKRKVRPVKFFVPRSAMFWRSA